jgi:hypothetical protein
MKGGVAMMIAALLRTKLDGLRSPGDVVLAIVCDEEAGGDLGSKFPVIKSWLISLLVGSSLFLRLQQYGQSSSTASSRESSSSLRNSVFSVSSFGTSA